MNIVAEMLLTEPAPMAIWAILMLLTMPALVVLASPHNVRHPGRALIDTVGFLRRRAERRDEERRQRSAEAAQEIRYAEEVRVAADQAGGAVRRWQEHWEAAGERVGATFEAWQAADARWARSRSAAPYGTPFTTQNPAEYAYRERFLHLVVSTAVERGELPAGAVADALNGREGWQPWLHPAEQEIAVQRASARYLEGLYRAAVLAERVAWHDVELARRSWDSLQREAAVAGARAEAARPLLVPEPVAVFDGAGRPVFA